MEAESSYALIPENNSSEVWEVAAMSWSWKDTCSLPLRMIVRLTMRWNHFASWIFTSTRHCNAMATGGNSSSICCRYHFSIHQSVQRENKGPFAVSPTGASASPSPVSPCPPIPFPGSRVLLACSPHTFYLGSPVPCRRSELNHTN